MRSLVATLCLAALVVVSCGEGEVMDCFCKVSIGEEAIELACGAQGCIGDNMFGCDDDIVVELGRCFPPDLAGIDDGACIASQAFCEQNGTACCASLPVGSGAAPPTCDPISRRCCVPMGQACATSADCCQQHVCLAVSDGKRCG